MTGQFDMFSAPVEQPLAPTHTVAITEAAIGDPAVKRGYLGKYRGSWMHLLVSAATFNRYNDIERQGMQDRLRACLEQGQ